MTVENGRWLKAADTTPPVEGIYRVICEAGMPNKAHWSPDKGWTIRFRNSSGFLAYEPLDDVRWWLQNSQEAPTP